MKAAIKKLRNDECVVSLGAYFILHKISYLH